jgi:hypothetical protein
MEVVPVGQILNASGEKKEGVKKLPEGRPFH